MKLLSDVAKNYLPEQDKPKLVHAVQHLFTEEFLDIPIMSSEVVCPLCGGKNGLTCMMYPSNKDKRLWFCLELNCLTAINRSKMGQYVPIASSERILQWPKFCDLNGIGDVEYDVKFEFIQQSSSKISYLKNFVKAPRGIILMQGTPGTGKTYCALAACEFFTRYNHSCLFFTERSLINEWLEPNKTAHKSSLRERLIAPVLLVIDEFGQKEPSPSFLQLMMDVINTRLQWKNKGTIITTNLNSEKFSIFCGDALSDRINTGQLFIFDGPSRRQKTPL